MPLVRWDPFGELNSLHEQMNSLFNQAFGQSTAQLMPVTDVYSENDKAMTVEVHLPNFNEDEVAVDIQDGALVIAASHHEKEKDDKKRKYLVRESSSSFYRRVALPKQADQEAITAHFDKGVLKVTVPYKELPKPKRIAISSSEKKNSL